MEDEITTMLRVGALRRAIVPPKELEKIGAEEGDIVQVTVKKIELKEEEK